MDYSRKIIKTDMIVPTSSSGSVLMPRALVTSRMTIGTAAASLAFALPASSMNNMMQYASSSLTAAFTMSMPAASDVQAYMMTTGSGDVRVGDVYKVLVAFTGSANTAATGIVSTNVGVTVYPAASLVASAPWIIQNDILAIDYIMTAIGTAPTATAIVMH